MIVRNILQYKGSKVVSTHPEASIAEAAKMLFSNRIGAALVIDGGNTIVGIFSERDIVRGMAVHGDQVEKMKVADLMSRNVLTCSPNDRLEKLMATMTTNRVRHLPVVEDGALIGIVTIGDVVKNRLEEATMEVSSLRDYVAGSR